MHYLQARRISNTGLLMQRESKLIPKAMHNAHLLILNDTVISHYSSEEHHHHHSRLSHCYDLPVDIMLLTDANSMKVL